MSHTCKIDHGTFGKCHFIQRSEKKKYERYSDGESKREKEWRAT